MISKSTISPATLDDSTIHRRSYYGMQCDAEMMQWDFYLDDCGWSEDADTNFLIYILPKQAPVHNPYSFVVKLYLCIKF